MNVDKTVEVQLTKSQVNNLVEFFDIGFIPFIRELVDLDNMDYLVDMCELYKKLVAADKVLR